MKVLFLLVVVFLCAGVINAFHPMLHQHRQLSNFGLRMSDTKATDQNVDAAKAALKGIAQKLKSDPKYSLSSNPQERELVVRSNPKLTSLDVEIKRTIATVEDPNTGLKTIDNLDTTVKEIKEDLKKLRPQAPVSQFFKQGAGSKNDTSKLQALKQKLNEKLQAKGKTPL
jgi:hypothetical protein